MLSKGTESRRPFRRESGEVWDPVSQTTFTLSNDDLFIKNDHSDATSKISLSGLPSKVASLPVVLKFKNTQNRNMLVSPSGQTLTCKSDRLQQCDMNMSFKQGVSLWGIYCSGNCLLLTIGVRGTKSKKEYPLQFTAQSALKISFKLDLENKRFSAWVTKAIHEMTKEIKINEEDEEWTPFVRIKGAGVHTFLSNLIEDPENVVSVYNRFGTVAKIENLSVDLDKIEEQEPIVDQQNAPTFSELNVLDENTILIKGDQKIRLLRRDHSEKEFNLNLSEMLSDGRIKISFSRTQLEILKLAGIQVKSEIKDYNYASNTLEGWIAWGRNACAYLDSRRNSKILVSESILSRVYEIILSKLQTFRLSCNQFIHVSVASEFDQQLLFGINHSIFPQIQTPFTIPKNVVLNNAPPTQFDQKIRSIDATEHFMVIRFLEGDKICIMNRDFQLFKIADLVLKKGIKKETQLNQYKKELEELQAASSAEPSIYKILKNCLKYADKVKPPEKILKKMEEKAAQKKEGKEKKETDTGLEPDKSILNTLISMGFALNPARKALLQCKNSSLEDAMDLILKKYSNEVEQQPKISTFNSKDWRCEICTLINNPSAMTCDACTSPRPMVNEQQAEQKIEEEIEKKEEQKFDKIQEIKSQNIENQEMSSLFAWESDFAFAPLIIGGVFENSIRIRLFGPNPKYYSNFYSHDEEFIDLSNFSVHSHASEIDQRPVRYQFYAASTPQQQKELSYGWISLEDNDIPITKKVKKVQIVNRSQTKKEIIFEISILFEDNSFTYNQLKISKENIFVQNIRSMKITQLQNCEAKEVESELHKQKSAIVQRNSNVVPSNGELKIEFVHLEHNKPFEFSPEIKVCGQIMEKVPGNKNNGYLPLCCISSEKSVQLAYPKAPLHPGMRPLVLKHIRDLQFSVSGIVIEKIGKNATFNDHKGYYWFSKDYEKIPLTKYSFVIPKGSKKVFIPCPKQETIICGYVSIELEKQEQEDLAFIEELTLSGVCGESYNSKVSRQIGYSTKIIDEQLRLEVTDKQNSVSKEFRYKIYAINSSIDLGIATEKEGEEILHKQLSEGRSVDLMGVIYGNPTSELYLKKLELPGWKMVRQTSVYSLKHESIITEVQFKDYLNNFIASTSLDLLGVILDDKNRDFRSLLTTEKYNLTEFFMKILQPDLQRITKFRYAEFIKKFSSYIVDSAKAGNLDLQAIINHSLPLHSQSALQLAFDLIKLFDCDQPMMQVKLEERMAQFLEKKSTLSKNISLNENEDGKIVRQKRDDLIYSQFLVKKGKVYKKIIVDLFNVYEIKEILLNFEKSEKKSPMRIMVYSMGETIHKELQIFYSESVFEQLAYNFDENSKKNMSQALSLPLDTSKRIKSRYIIIEISFAVIPHDPSLREIEKMPQCQIFPEISGNYIGESDQLFNDFQFNMKKLNFIKRYNEINKYSISAKGYETTYYYIGEAVEPANIEMKEEVEDKSGQIGSFKYLHSSLSLILSDLTSRGGVKEPNQKLTTYLVEMLNNVQRNQLTDKIVNYLKKLCRNNEKYAHTFLNYHRINNEGIFHQIFRDSSLSIEAVKREVKGELSATCWNNILWYTKSKSSNPQIASLVSDIFSFSLRNKKTDEILMLFEKFGWVDTKICEQIADSFVRTNRSSNFKTVLKSCKDNLLLANYVSKLIFEFGYEYFAMGLEELKNSERKIKANEVAIVIREFIRYISEKCGSINDSFDEAELNEEFSSLANQMNYFQIKEQTLVVSFIDNFSKLSSKRALIKMFLATESLKNQIYAEKLIEISLKILEDVVSMKLGQAQLQEHLSFAYDILIFLFRNQVDIFNSEDQKSVLANLSSSIMTRILKVFSRLLINELNIGGEINIKIFDSIVMLKLSVISSLGSVIARNLQFQPIKKVEDSVLAEILKWLLYNVSVKHSKNTASKWEKIESVAWKLFSGLTTLNYQIIENEIDSFLKQVEKNIGKGNKNQENSSVILFAKMNLNKVYICIKKLMEKIEDQQIGENLLKKGFLEKILRKVVEISQYIDLDEALNSNEEFLNEINEKELANSFVLEQNVKDQPKDWLIYKNGAKNSVYQFEYSKSSSQSYEMVLKFNKKDHLTLSKIIIGFQYKTSTDQTSCIPSQIIVEVGSSLKQLKYVGKMIPIPDDHFINYSVQVFGLNVNQCSFSKLFKKLNKLSEVNYVRLTISCKNRSSLDDALLIHKDASKQKVLKSSINFLSIQGYHFDEALPNPEIPSLVQVIKLFSEVKYKKVLEELFSDEKIVRQFNDALPNIGQLMKNENYEKILHKFVMRICQVNHLIGDQTIQKYLTHQNSGLCSKIVVQIILGTPAYFPERLQMLNKFIIESIEKGILPKIQPFLERFCQIINVAEQQASIYGKGEKICLHVDFKSIQHLILKENTTEVVARYLTSILSLDTQVYTIDLGDQFQGIYSLLKINAAKSSLNESVLLALIIGDKSARSWYMKNNQLENLYNKIAQLICTTKDASLIVKNLDTLSELCMNSNIKSILNKNKYNIEIFKKLLEEHQLLTKEENNALRNSFVNFIIRSVLNTENQNVVGEMLKESLMSNIVESNQSFVGQVFLPILNSFNKIPVSIIPYEKAQKKIVIDFNSLSLPSRNPDKKLSKINKKSQSKTDKFRLPSNILTPDLKEDFITELKSRNKITSGQFNLSCNHGSSPFNDNIDNVLLNKKSLLILFKLSGTKNPDTTVILGVYSHNSGSISNSINWNDKCMLFLAQSNKKTFEYPDIKSQIGKKMWTLHQDNIFDDEFESSFDEKNIELEIDYNNIPFAEISYSSGVQFADSSYFSLNALSTNTNFDNMILQSAEYWELESQPHDKKVEPVDDQPSLTSLILENSAFQNLSFVSKDFATHSAVRFLRPLNMFQFPSSITACQFKQAIQIIKCRLNIDGLQELPLYILNNKNELEKIENDATLLSLMKKNNEKPILDIFFEIDGLENSIDFSSNNSAKHLEYLPRKGILKYFEQNNGITSMIKVLKKSIEGWKNVARKEKWSQYVVELQKFSNFPHFFGMYLKDNQTFDLLFKLLSGLPDTESNDKRWEQIEAKSSQKLLKIVSQILQVDKSSEFREYALKHDFFETILERLRILTGIFKREYHEKVEEEIEELAAQKKMSEDDGTKQIKKKKGVGYGNDGSSNTKWMKGISEADLKKEFEVTEIILNMIENFIDFRNWKIPKKLLDNIYASALLPYLEDSLRAGTLLQISKHPTKFKLVFKILKTLSQNQQLVPILMRIPKNYQPKQIEPIVQLMKSLENNANIFLSCLKQSKDTSKNDKNSEELAKQIIQTCKSIDEAIEKYNDLNEDENQLEEEMKNILELPTDKQYRILLKDLRFDYIDMKEGNKIKHHYSSSFSQNYTPNQNKMIRLAQQLADISTALPFEHTNAIYVRCDKDRVDFMQALIMGSNGTPYGHGAFLFDVYFDDNYPNGPPKVNLTTTGHGKVRFNPNLYACGKVCLSLLGTWRGSASENWDPKVSTLLQVLLSIQAIIMSEQVYFNEPGFENEQGTTEGQKKNEAYSNIVRYSNLKFAMIENIRSPPKGFQTVIRRHFYIKRHEIMDECKKWLLYAEKRQANYVGLVNDHNNSWSTQFKKSKTQYKEMLQKAIKELEEEFKKLQPPSIHDIISKSAQKKKKKKNVDKKGINLLEKLEKQLGEQIDVTYQKSGIDIQSKEIDINDEKVKDRWSRYIGAMGVDAVSKQSKADILVFGLNPMSLEVVKNLVMSGCRKLTICDSKKVSWQDLAGGFFFGQEDIGKLRTDAALHKIKELNMYVKVDAILKEKVDLELIKSYHIVFISEMPIQEQFTINEFCRNNKIKFISAESRGACCRLLNDLGQNFEVLDKNGEQPVEVIIKDITCEQTATVTLLDGSKHPYEDGEAVLIKDVEGMQNKEDATKSINGTIHKIKVINSRSFTIGDTRSYTPYIRNGTVKNIKTPVILKFKSMKEVYGNVSEEIPLDENLQFYDFVKMDRNKIIHNCFVALDLFVQDNKDVPRPWNLEDALKFEQIFNKLHNSEIDEKTKKYVQKFSFTCSGFLPPLAAYFGGYVSQEIIKAITQKYKPTYSTFYMDSAEIIPDLPETEDKLLEAIKSIYSGDSKRLKGLEIVIGKDLLNLIRDSKLFMIGAGAIGCELLKNFAMVGLGSGEKGKITLTDPDHIENSNLNRQFLFREKHISKPKSRTAAASIMNMNPELKGHVSALLQRVSDKTKDIFSNNFFQSLTLVANALDNVAARRYVDQRCVQNKIPLFESGTLGPKGHIQVILPFKTESYGSQNDPVEEGEIPHCTLKMFPEETLHCVEWARDIFGKKFSLQPKAFQKIKDKIYKPEKEDIKSLNQCIVMATKGPKTFEDCVSYAVQKFYKYFRDDIIQLLYTYPLDAKTKNGEPFWKLPKRPPTPVKCFDEGNILHCTFVSSMAVLIAKIYKIPYPKNFRQEKERRNIAKLACETLIPDFVPSDQKAKEILKESATDTEKKEQDQEDMVEQSMDISDKNQQDLHTEFLNQAQEMQVVPEEFEKDDDQNGHIDFIYAMANLRAQNYKLDEMDWITTKLKAGRIVPALSTTTTCVAGLQTLEICKYLKKSKLEDMRNSFLNLAVPSLQMSEPGEVKKIKLTDKLQVNIWDRWQVPCDENSTFGQVFEFLEKKYELNPIGVLQGMSRIDTSKSEAGKKEFLNSKVLDKLDKDEAYIDIVVLFTRKPQDEKMLENIPPIRLTFPN